MSDRDRVTVERLIPSPPGPIFDVLADPARHVEIDGSGTVQEARSGGRRLRQGDSFGMDMHWKVAYSTRNVVTELEEDRTIAWRTDRRASVHGSSCKPFSRVPALCELRRRPVATTVMKSGQIPTLMVSGKMPGI